MNDYLEPYREDIGKDAINALPMVSYDGPVRVVEREEELPEVLKLLQGDTLLGLDTEMRPCFERGKPLRPTALLQLAGERAVVLVRLKNVPIAGPLAALLGDPNILKVGVAIGDDMRLMRRNATFTAAGMVDLAQTARLCGHTHVRIALTGCEFFESSHQQGGTVFQLGKGGIVRATDSVRCY